MTIAIQCHQPCPDMPSYGLNKQQKQRGLEKLRQVRKALGEKQLAELRIQYAATDSKAEKQKLLDRAHHIEQVWC